jgi:hypothetical protein
MISEDDITPESLAEEFPGWEPWQGIEGLWHARIRGATPPVMVHAEDPTDLRDQIIVHLRRAEMYGAGRIDSDPHWACGKAPAA